jgi:hypothetical protein
MYDYGHEKNMLLYNTTLAPEYNITALNNLTMDIFITVSESDPYCNKEDFAFMTKVLMKAKKTVHKVSNYNHNDYLWSKSAHADIYEHIKEFLK